jgi:PPOX class probable F420-dependent enzyme
VSFERTIPHRPRALLRATERHLYANALHPHADDLSGVPGPWDLEVLMGHRYLLLVSYRRDGIPVPTPVWFAAAGVRVVIRSAASDGKIKRIRNQPTVRIAPCSLRGRAFSAPMLGRARILEPDEEEQAEQTLRASLGLQRRLYNLLRQPLLDALYVEVRDQRPG